jgi:hypothetical protein
MTFVHVDWANYTLCFAAGTISRPGDQISDGGFPDFPQSPQTNARIVPKIRLRSLPSISFQIHSLLIIIPFYAISL